ncbi:uncharacterized protein CBL_02332 [Carabus blaptoides fortunei]
MSARSKLQATMEALAKKRQKEFDEQLKWTDQTQYYKNWDRHNNQYQNWTSSQYYASSLDQYDAAQKQRRKKENLESRREKIRKLLFDEEQEYILEMSQSPRNGRPGGHLKWNQTPTEVLKDVNIGLKIADDDRKRHEAELKLYHQWRNENPVIKEHEASHGKAGLKLAWLDQQIEKRMEQEKTEEETRKMIEERDRLIKEDEKLEKQELELQGRKEKEIMSQIELQIQHFKLKDEQAEHLKHEEMQVLAKKREVEELLERRNADIKRRKQFELSLFNMNQSKMKLRKKALDVEEQLKHERKIIEDIIASQAAEEIENEDKRSASKKAIVSFLNYVKEQQQLEEQRERYIAFIFDSEAKNMWEKQERLWREEQEARDRLIADVLVGIKEQIQEKINKNQDKQRLLLKEREEMLQVIEESEQVMRQEKEDMVQKKAGRKMELEKQINDKRIGERQKK